MSKYAAKNLIAYKCKVNKLKRGYQHKVNKSSDVCIKKEISKLTQQGEKVNSAKIKKNCALTVSTRTMQRHFKSLNMIYKNSSHEILLSKKYKEGRMTVKSEWISGNHSWENTVFTDEKRFSLDGPDSWMTYVPSNCKYIRHKRQCHGGGTTVWITVIPQDKGKI